MGKHHTRQQLKPGRRNGILNAKMSSMFTDVRFAIIGMLGIRIEGWGNARN